MMKRSAPLTGHNHATRRSCIAGVLPRPSSRLAPLPASSCTFQLLPGLPHTLPHARPHALSQSTCSRLVMTSRRPGLAACALPPSPLASQGQGQGREQLEALIRQADGDGDGRLTLAEVVELVQGMQLPPAAPPQPAPAAPPPPAPLSWDLHLLTHTLAAAAGSAHSVSSSSSNASSSNASSSNASRATNGTSSSSNVSSSSSSAGGGGGAVGLAACLFRFLAVKLSNQHRNRVLASDLLWTFLGAFSAALLLGLAAAQVRSWPLVGHWHQQGLNLLIGSFGTISVLLFARPEAEAIKVWNLLAGHVLSICIVLLVVHFMGSTPLARASAMGLAITAMLFTDSVHPPGGALVLLAVDSGVVQDMGLSFLLYPSLTFTLLLLMPLGIITNWLKRRVRFDFPAQGSLWHNPQPGGAGDVQLKLKPI